MPLLRTLLLISALVIGQAHADQKILKRAETAANAGDYAITYCLLLPLAKTGNPEAQNRLAWLYHLGNGLAIDDNEALRWWEQAASQGNLEATMALADLYRQGGKGIRPDDEKAIHYLFIAARGGEEDAPLLLASYFSKNTKPAVRETAARIISESPGLLGVPLSIKVPKANLRSGPGTGYKVAGSLKQGAKAYELTRQGEWILITLTEKPWMAWIFAKLTEPLDIEETPAVPTP